MYTMDLSTLLTSGNDSCTFYRFEKCKLNELGIEEKYMTLLLQFDGKIYAIKKVM